jgi:multidrug efflux pump subunit AcrA (membrane-fusion protein)
MKIKLTPIFRSLLAIALFSLALAACGAKAPASSDPTAAPAVTESANNLLNIGADNPAASGVVVAEQDARVAFTLGGVLKSVNVVEGQQIEAGQVLATLDDSLIQLDYTQAERNLKELTSPAALAAAAQNLALARQSLEDQQEKVNAQLYKRASDTQIDNVQGEIELAKQALARAADAYRLVARKEDSDPRKAAALVAMTNAQLRLDDLIALYNWYSGKPTDTDNALAQAKLDTAKAAVQEGEWYLAVLKGEQVPAEATGPNLARLEQARITLASIKDRLSRSSLSAPIPGTLLDVNAIPGDNIAPGQILFSISNVNQLHVETSDLSERDVPRVFVGQTVEVSIKALNLSIPGKVVRISPVANILGGDVVYKTIIALDEAPAGLLAGMSVDVIYQVEK